MEVPVAFMVSLRWRHPWPKDHRACPGAGWTQWEGATCLGACWGLEEQSYRSR